MLLDYEASAAIVWQGQQFGKKLRRKQCRAADVCTAGEPVNKAWFAGKGDNYFFDTAGR